MNIKEEQSLTRALEAAVHTNGFELLYQPKFDLRTGALCGAEALARWNCAVRGPVTPSQFIPMLEKSRLIVPMGEWVMQQVARDQRAWRQAGLSIAVAVNVSPVQLAAPSFAKTLVDAVQTAGAALELEITESVLIDSIDEVMPKLELARALGVTIALDDFGTGYSSLRYLVRLPVTALKVDGTFISRMVEDPRVSRLVAAIVSMGHAIGLRVVGEGVETGAQLRHLERLQFDEAQGCLIAHPLPATEFARRFCRRPESAPYAPHQAIRSGYREPAPLERAVPVGSRLLRHA